MLPTLDRAGDAALARWRPVVQGSTGWPLDNLVTALPPVGRAESRPRRPGAPAPAPTRRRWSRTRSRCSPTPPSATGWPAPRPITLVPPRRGRVPARPPAAEAWLAALLTPDARVGGAGGVRRGSWPRWPRRWPRGTRSAPPPAGRRAGQLPAVRGAHPARPGRPGPRPGRPDRRRHPLRAGVLPAVHRRPEPAGAGRAGLGRARRPAARRAAGAAARRAGPGRARVPAARARRCAQARPAVLELELGGAHEFLTAGAPLLVAAGFGVQLPAGWDGSRRVGLTLSTRSTPADRVLTRSGLGRETLADFRWSIAVGDDELSEEELTELVAAKAPLVRVRGRWVSVDAAAAAPPGLEFLRRAGAAAGRPDRGRGAGAGPAPPGRLGRRRGGAAAGHRGARARAGSATCWPAGPTAAITPVEPPPGFRAQLRPYQQRGRVLAGLPVLARARRLPGRRHGPGQDRAAARPGGPRAGRGRRAARRC